MAHHKSAKKRINQTRKKSAVNKHKISRVRTFIKKVNAAILAKDTGLATELFKTAQSLIAKAAKSPALPKDRASRLTSRLAQKLKTLA